MLQPNLIDTIEVKTSEICEEIKEGYQAPEEVPVFAYAALMGAYALTFAGLYHLATKDGRKLEKPKGLDLALLTIASYKLSRVVTMSFIGTPVRAAFAKRGKSLKGGEVQDEARGEGIQRAVGNLVTCPFCFSVWSTTFFMFGYTIAKQATTQAAYVMSVAAAGDFLHLGYRNIREASR